VALAFAARYPQRCLAVVCVDGGLAGPSGLPPGSDRATVRARLAPPRLAVPPEDLPAMLAAGPLRPWWTPAHAAALLPGFEVGDDGLARPRLPYRTHLEIVDSMLEADPEATLPAVRCPAWVVFCEPLPGTGPEADPEAEGIWQQARATGWDRACRLLTRPRLLRWFGAVHDVPLQWPALVAGLVRAAVDEISAGALQRRPEGGPG
jgi:pimeloyl-ACP methyl ester carboxylesterase